ncbi:MAG: hypothetical protein IPH42_07240 [Bacteroidetes bacterium]|nr:hypothetical protein [Bacteroidota bacterium]
MEHLVDLDANTIEVIINGVSVLSDVYTANLGGVDFYSTGAVNRLFLDDILFIEEAGTPTTYYQDADGDGFGNAAVFIDVIGDPPAGYVADNTDCDDTNDAIYPGATEIENDLDDDCDGQIDDGVIAIEDLNAHLVFMNIYPVASNGIFTLEIINTSLEAANGKIVKQINIENNASGIYQVQLISGTDVLNKQVVIQNNYSVLFIKKIPSFWRDLFMLK